MTSIIPRISVVRKFGALIARDAFVGVERVLAHQFAGRLDMLGGQVLSGPEWPLGQSGMQDGERGVAELPRLRLQVRTEQGGLAPTDEHFGASRRYGKGLTAECGCEQAGEKEAFHVEARVKDKVTESSDETECDTSPIVRVVAQSRRLTSPSS